MIKKLLTEHLNKKYLENLNNLNITNKKIAILFSGVPASGKTFLARIIEKRYKAIRINKDSIGEIINKFKSITIKEKENLADNYIFYLLNNWKFNNKLIILDKSIDRKYKKIFRILSRNNFKKFIIRVNISKKEQIKRLRKRNKRNISDWLAKIDEWFFDFNKSRKNIKPDFKYESKKDLRRLFAVLDKKLD